MSRTETLQKYGILIDFIKTGATFKLTELCRAFEVSNTISIILRKRGFLQNHSGNEYIMTEKATSLNAASLADMVSAYNAEKKEIRAKNPPKKKMTISDFLNRQVSADNKLAKEIYELIKPYL